MDKKEIPELRFPGFEGEWEEKKLGSYARITDGTHQTPQYKDTGIRFVSVEDISNLTGTEKYISNYDFEKEYANKKARRGDILMSRIGDIGTPAIIDFDDEVAYYVTLALLRIYNDNLISHYLYHYIQTDRFQKELFKKTLHVAFPKKINLGEIGQTLISIPLLKEQEKLSSLFCLLDRKIEKQEEKTKYLEKYKKGMMQKLFPAKGEKVPELRFEEFDGAWAEKRLGDVLIERNIKANDGDYKVISSTTKGLFYQSDYFDRDIASTNRSDYKILKQNQIVFSPQNLWMGNINYNKIIEIGIVSPSYKIYDVKKSFKADYIGQILKTPYMMYQYVISSEQGASMVRRNLNMDLFNLCIIKAPSFLEQEKISFFLVKLDQLIILNQDKLEALKELKKGLMQKMFV